MEAGIIVGEKGRGRGAEDMRKHLQNTFTKIILVPFGHGVRFDEGNNNNCFGTMRSQTFKELIYQYGN